MDSQQTSIHSPVVAQLAMFQCNLCYKSFDSTDSISVHCREKHNYVAFCAKCCKVLEPNVSLGEHMKNVHHFIGGHTCGCCFTLFSEESHLADHKIAMIKSGMMGSYSPLGGTMLIKTSFQEFVFQNLLRETVTPRLPTVPLIFNGKSVSYENDPVWTVYKEAIRKVMSKKKLTAKSLLREDVWKEVINSATNLISDALKIVNVDEINSHIPPEKETGTTVEEVQMILLNNAVKTVISSNKITVEQISDPKVCMEVLVAAQMVLIDTAEKMMAKLNK